MRIKSRLLEIANIGKFSKYLNELIPKINSETGMNFRPQMSGDPYTLTLKAIDADKGIGTIVLTTNNRNIDKNDNLYGTLSIDGHKVDLGSLSGKDVDTDFEKVSDSYETIKSDIEAPARDAEQKAAEQKAADETRKARADALRAANKQAIQNTPSSTPQETKKQETPQVDTDKIGSDIVKILANYGVKVNYEEATVGPAITQYEFTVAPGTKISTVKNLNKEIAMGLSVTKVAIDQVEGKNTIGIQVPNGATSLVSLDDVLAHSEKSGVSVALGKDLQGNSVQADILKMQHVLIGGTTGSGKSVAISTMIASLIQGYTPDQVKLILVDPKKVELDAFKNLPHLLRPIVTDPKDADAMLKDMVKEMETRYQEFSDVGVKNIAAYNQTIDRYNKQNPDKPEKMMPYIVIIIDELADLMMTAGKTVEASIQRLTQLSRAAGIHLIVATQRPSVDIVTGPIKANIASRISFATASGTDSRTILDQTGAENLMGKGDMLFKPVGAANPKRIQGVYADDDEIARIVQAVEDKYGTRQS